eukprot:g2601.t1
MREMLRDSTLHINRKSHFREMLQLRIDAVETANLEESDLEIVAMLSIVEDIRKQIVAMIFKNRKAASESFGPIYSDVSFNNILMDAQANVFLVDLGAMHTHGRPPVHVETFPELHAKWNGNPSLIRTRDAIEAHVSWSLGFLLASMLLPEESADEDFLRFQANDGYARTTVKSKKRSDFQRTGYAGTYANDRQKSYAASRGAKMKQTEAKKKKKKSKVNESSGRYSNSDRSEPYDMRGDCDSKLSTKTARRVVALDTTPTRPFSEEEDKERRYFGTDSVTASSDETRAGRASASRNLSNFTIERARLRTLISKLRAENDELAERLAAADDKLRNLEQECKSKASRERVEAVESELSKTRIRLKSCLRRAREDKEAWNLALETLKTENRRLVLELESSKEESRVHFDIVSKLQETNTELEAKIVALESKRDDDVVDLYETFASSPRRADRVSDTISAEKVTQAILDDASSEVSVLLQGTNTELEAKIVALESKRDDDVVDLYETFASSPRRVDRVSDTISAEKVAQAILDDASSEVSVLSPLRARHPDESDKFIASRVDPFLRRASPRVLLCALRSAKNATQLQHQGRPRSRRPLPPASNRHDDSSIDDTSKRTSVRNEASFGSLLSLFRKESDAETEETISKEKFVEILRKRSKKAGGLSLGSEDVRQCVLLFESVGDPSRIDFISFVNFLKGTF